MQNKPSKTSGKALLLLFLTLCLIYTLHEPFLNLIGEQLVYQDIIHPCDAIVVLAGDQTGDRLMTGINLYKKGFGKKIVFWGGTIYWKITWADLFLKQMKENGIEPESAIWSEEKLAQISTLGEAQVNMRMLKSINARSFIVVTSIYHSARAKYVYAPLAKKNGMEVYLHPAEGVNGGLDGWWRNRETAKVVFYELQKTFWYRLFY